MNWRKPTKGQIWSVFAFAMYWCWTFCVLLTNAFTPDIDIQALIPLDAWFISTLFHMATLLIIWRVSEIKSSFVSDGVLVMVGPSFCLAGLVLLIASSSTAIDLVFSVLMGSVLSGVGTGCLAIAWGRSFVACCADQGKQPLLFSAIIIAAALELVLSWLPYELFVTVLALFPLASVFFSRMASNSSFSSEVVRHKVAYRNEGLTPRFAVFCMVFPIPLGLFQTRFSTDLGSVGNWAPVLGPSILLLLVVFAVDALLLKKRRINLSEKLIMPVMVAGLFVLASFGGQSMHVAGILVFVAQQIMSVVLYARFGVIASKGDISATKAFSLGIVATDVGFIIGIIAGVIMNSLSPDDGVNIILGIAYLMVIVTFFTMGSFLKGKNEDGGTDGALAGFGVEWLDELASHHALTPREREMLDYLLRGKSVPAIASEVFLSANTVRTHIAHIYQKFDVHSRDELLEAIEKSRHSES